MTDWSKLTVVKLKEELKSRSLSTAGLKAQLVSRLEEDDAAPASAPEEENAAAKESPEAATSDPPVPANEAAPNQPAENKPVDDTESKEPTKDEEKEAIPAPVEAIQDVRVADNLGEASEKTKAEAESEEVATDKDVPMQDAETSGPEPPRKQETTPIQAVDERSSVGHPQSTPKPDEVMPGVATQAENGETQPTHTQGEANSKLERSQSVIAETQVTVDLHEVLEDSRKRKRRSVSPPPLTQDMVMKKMRGEDGSPRVKLPDGVVEVQPMATDPSKPAVDSESPRKPSQADARFKGLFVSNQSSPPQAVGNSADPSRDVAPAVHPATAALYIRNLMRPLQPTSLREHLKKLAQPEASEGGEDMVQEFYLDSIKSHGLVQFTTITAASRVRAALHDTVWPDEKSRKPLWVDYVPVAKVKKWIEVELDSAGSRPPKKWEVVYNEEADGIEASLQEADSAGPRKDSTTPKAPPPAAAAARAPDPKPPSPKGDSGQGFQALDDLFRSTAAKPKLYFLPVPARVAEAREARLAAGRGGGRSDEMRRFTFEGKDLVDDGPEFRPGYRGGGPRGRGGYMGRGGGPRGGGGDSWRGGRER